MLALSRKEGERIRFTLPDGRYIWVMVLERTRLRGVTLGIDCPRDIRIEREEIIAATDSK